MIIKTNNYDNKVSPIKPFQSEKMYIFLLNLLLFNLFFINDIKVYIIYHTVLYNKIDKGIPF